MSAKQQLEQAAGNGSLVRIYRTGLEDGWADGYVAGTGPEFFALELVDKAIRYDGYNCMRYDDVTQCDVPAPHSGFVETALKLRGLQRNNRAIDMSSLPALLRSAAEAFPVVTIHLACIIHEVASPA